MAFTLRFCVLHFLKRLSQKSLRIWIAFIREYNLALQWVLSILSTAIRTDIIFARERLFCALQTFQPVVEQGGPVARDCAWRRRVPVCFAMLQQCYGKFSRGA
jgi:hypothetical protein